MKRIQPRLAFPKLYTFQLDRQTIQRLQRLSDTSGYDVSEIARFAAIFRGQKEDDLASRCYPVWLDRQGNEVSPPIKEITEILPQPEPLFPYALKISLGSLRPPTDNSDLLLSSIILRESIGFYAVLADNAALGISFAMRNGRSGIARHYPLPPSRPSFKPQENMLRRRSIPA